MPEHSSFLIISFIFSAGLLLTGCGVEEVGEVPTSGTDTLSSDQQWSGGVLETPGFDFSEARIRFDNGLAPESIVDISLGVIKNASNQPIGANFFLPVERPFIQDMGSILLSEITQAPETGYLYSMQNIWIGYSYCILTAEGKYAKLSVDDLTWDYREGGMPFAWMRFEWVYQSEGGREFNN
jgi:hypothetical protein